MPTRFNHYNLIEDTQPATVKSIIPGMILTFRYEKPKTQDKNPLILFLWYDSKNKVIDGLNLNYLSLYRFHELFENFKSKTKVGTKDEDTSKLLSEDYTLISIPPTTKVSRPKSRSEKKVEMKRMYDKFIAPGGKEHGYKGVYRSYKVTNIRTLKAVDLKDY
jgi:hypothetical protein